MSGNGSERGKPLRLRRPHKLHIIRPAASGLRLQVPEVVAEATEAYRAREDWLSNFLSERCVVEANARVGAAELYQAYKDWATSTGEYVRRLSDFTAAMEAAGYVRITPKGRKLWSGIRVAVGCD